MGKNLKFIIVLSFAFILSRIYFYFNGLRFDDSTLNWFYQFLDPAILRTNLLPSLFYLHIQPPGFNLFVGLVLRFPANLETTIFSAIYYIMGFSITIILFLLINELSRMPGLAFAISLFFSISPPVILYENWLFYTYPVTFLLLLSTLFLYTYLQNRSYTNLFLFFLTLMLIAVTRSLFHLLWFVMITLYLFFIEKNKKQVFITALLPFLVIAGLYIKNYIIFREPGVSSWFGMNLIKMTSTIPENKVIPLIRRGEVSGISLIPPFRAPDYYRGYANFDSVTLITVLDEKYKSTGFINFNNIGYLRVSRLYLKSAFYLIRRFPQYYFLSVLKAWYHFLRPCSDRSIFSPEVRKRLVPWIDIYEYYFVGDILKVLGQRTYQNREGQTRIVHLNFLFFTIPLLFFWSFLLSFWPRVRFDLNKNGLITLRYIFFNILYVSLLGNLIETGENMRFRFLILPGLYIFSALFIKYLISSRAR